MTEPEQKDRLKRKSVTDICFFDSQKDQCFVRREIVIKRFDTIFRKWTVSERTKQVLPLLEAKPELKKEIKLKILFKREAVSTESLLPTEAYFTQILTFLVPNDFAHRHVYLVLTENGYIVLNDMQKDYATKLDVSDKNYLASKSEPKRITYEKAIELQKREGLQVFSEIKGSLEKRFFFKG